MKKIRLLTLLMVLVLLIGVCACAKPVDSSGSESLSSESLSDGPQNLPLPEELSMNYDEFFAKERYFSSVASYYATTNYIGPWGQNLYVDEDGSQHDCADGEGHILEYASAHDFVQGNAPLRCFSSLRVLWLDQSQAGLIVATFDNAICMMDHDGGNLRILLELEEPFVELNVGDPMAYVATTRSLYRIFLPDERIEKLYEIPLNDKVHEISSIVPLSTTDVRLQLRDTSVPQVENWFGTGDGYTYHPCIFSAITAKTYDIPDHIFPNLTDYLAARRSDIIAMGQDPDQIVSTDERLYTHYDND